MSGPFIEIKSVPELDEFLASTNGVTAVLFKHSNSCGVSSRAHAELSRLSQPVGLITVQRSRPVSDEVEKRWQIPHETPQVLLVRDGRLVWDASHFNVRATSVEAALASAGGA
jgi:bacillithiol system protein YtxJ